MADEIEQLLAKLEKSISASEEKDDKEKAARVALVKQVAESMSDDEKKEARKAFETEDDKKEAKKSNEDEEKKEAKKSKSSAEDEEKNGNDEEKKEAKKSKTSTTHDDHPKDSNEDENKEKIASLTAKINYLTAKPIIQKMLTARENAGMGKEDLEKFGRSLYGKTVTEIQQRYEDDKVLFKSSPSLDASEDDVFSDIPFNGQGKSLSASDKTLEELLE